MSGTIIQLMAQNRNTGTLLKPFIFLIPHIRPIRMCWLSKFSKICYSVISNSTGITLFPINTITWLYNCNGLPASFFIQLPSTQQPELTFKNTFHDVTILLNKSQRHTIALQIKSRLLLGMPLESFLVSSPLSLFHPGHRFFSVKVS